MSVYCDEPHISHNKWVKDACAENTKRRVSMTEVRVKSFSGKCISAAQCQVGCTHCDLFFLSICIKGKESFFAPNWAANQGQASLLLSINAILNKVKTDVFDKI